MKKFFIYFIFIFCNLSINAISASFEESSKAIMNCADSKFKENSKPWHAASIPQWEKKDALLPFHTPKIKDKFILTYEREWPINWYNHREKILEGRYELDNKYFDYILNNASELNLKRILEFENKAEEKLAKVKHINPKYYTDKGKADAFYWGNKWKLYDEVAKIMDDYELKKIRKKRDEYVAWEWENSSAQLDAIHLSKSLFFSKMTVKEKLKIKKYKKAHINCENEHDKGKITFIQAWK